MEVYKFKCKCCGSTRYTKPDEDTYKCSYCGNTEEIIKKKVETIIIHEKPEGPSEEEIHQKLVESKKETFTQAIIMMVITILLGVVGVHKFIKGRIFLGIIYICTYGLFGIGLFIDSIKALVHLVNSAREYRQAKGGL